MINNIILPFDDIDHNLSNKKISKKYQNYFNRYDHYQSLYYIERLRILKDFFDEERYIIKTKKKISKNELYLMLNEVDKQYDIIEIKHVWNGNITKNINENNMNDGIFEWFIKLKTKIKLKNLNHIGGYNNIVNVVKPTFTPEYLIRYDHIDNKFKIPIIIVINGKQYDKIWYYSNNNNISQSEVLIYINYYIKKFLNEDDFNVKQLIMTYDGWLVIL
jgi:hypothetical protein